MSKIYVLGGSVYKSEKKFLKEVKRLTSREDFATSWVARMKYQVYDVCDTGNLSDYKTELDNAKLSNERDLQLKGLLGELSPQDILVSSIINMVSTNETNERVKTNQLRNLNSYKFEFDNFKKYINDNKKYFLNLSLDVDYLVSVLKVHNFRDCNFGRHYSYKERKYIDNPGSPELQEAFKLAKAQLRKKKSKNVKTS